MPIPSLTVVRSIRRKNLKNNPTQRDAYEGIIPRRQYLLRVLLFGNPVVFLSVVYIEGQTEVNAEQKTERILSSVVLPLTSRFAQAKILGVVKESFTKGSENQ